MRLRDKTAAVTGAASGIGEAVAIAFAREGARVACLDIDAAGATTTATRIADAGGHAIGVGTDIRSHSSLEGALAATRSAYGDVTILFANAGGVANSDSPTGGRVPFLELTSDAWRAGIELNLTGAFNTGLVFARHMAEAGGGAIVFTASQLAEVVQAGLAPYVVAKAGVRQLTKAMALELASRNIRVNAVAPGPTVTGANRRRYEQREVREATARATPLGRPAMPSEIVGAVVYLASDEASYTTGTTLFVDGGWTIT